MGRYDTDGDGLIEVEYLEQLDAVSYDADGDGTADRPGVGGRSRAAYAAAFPTSSGQSICDRDCYGFELTRSLDFDDPGSYRSGRVNSTWSNGRADWSGHQRHPRHLRRQRPHRQPQVKHQAVPHHLRQRRVASVGVLNAQADWGGAFATANFGEIKPQLLHGLRNPGSITWAGLSASTGQGSSGTAIPRPP